MNRKRVTLGEVLAVIVILGILAIILLPAFAGRCTSGNRRSACVNNLKQLGLVLNLYANENKDRFPPLDAAAGNFMFDTTLLYPEYLIDTAIVACPNDPEYDPKKNFRLTSDHPVDNTPEGQVHPDCITDISYGYLGWMIMYDEETEAFFEAYDEMSPEDYDKDIVVPEGKGNAETATLHRLEAGVDRFLITDTNVHMQGDLSGTSIVPIMWDQISTDISDFSHVPAGQNVLYLDGHVDFHRYDLTNTEFPTTPLTAAQFGGRTRDLIPYCEEQ